MSKRIIGYIVIVLGIAALILSLAADAIGIGGSPGIGWRQLTGAAVGLIVMIYGFWLASRKAK